MVPVSPPVVLLLAITLGACFFAWWHQNRRSARWRDLARWVEAHHGQVWATVPWALKALNLRGALRSLEQELDARFLRFFETLCQSGTKSGELDADLDASLFGAVVLGTLSAAAKDWSRSAASFDLRAQARARLELVFRGVRAS